MKDKITDWIKIVFILFVSVLIFFATFFSMLMVINAIPGATEELEDGTVTITSLPLVLAMCFLPFVSSGAFAAIMLKKYWKTTISPLFKANHSPLPSNTFINQKIKYRSHILEEDYDHAIDALYTSGKIVISEIQSALRISFPVAAEIMNKLEEKEIISPFVAGRNRTFLVSKSEALYILHSKTYEKIEKTDPLVDVDNMDGHAFEYWCADLIKKVGFSNVHVTKGSGDQGVDVLAEKDGIRYAIQCKCYSSDLGNTPVQEVHAGQSMYHCQIGVVMTNRHFTRGAKALAENTGVLLWDRDKLLEMMNSINPGVSIS